jgi:ubiquinone/menaquinone biosynthesis C-methylase UbiE
VNIPPDWFRDWFGEAYLELYPHRDEDEATEAVRLYLNHAELKAGQRVLDLACGAGRHLEQLRKAGLQITGLDLSRRLLTEATTRPGLTGTLVRGDMRKLPFTDASFDGLVSFFTSFGYFSTPEEDRVVLTEMRRVLSPGAYFILDFMNASWVIDRLTPTTEEVLNGRRVRQTRWIEEEYVCKRIEIERPDCSSSAIYHERVRLYRPEELEMLLHNAGFQTKSRSGSYGGVAFSKEMPRLLLLGVAE